MTAVSIPAAFRDAEEFECVCPESDALISDCGQYRYRLWRHWGDGCAGTAVFLMLNPSTADGHVDDPTIRKCVGFAKRWGLHGIRVVNLFALRSTDPKGLLGATDPVGPENDEHVDAVTNPARWHASDDARYRVVCAWGAVGSGALRKLIAARVRHVMVTLGRRELWCLGRSREGHPRHPLMLGYDTPLERFEGAPCR